MEQKPNENMIVDLSFKFALNVIKYTDELEVLRKYVLARQLLKSGTSIGANIREAQHAESRADFIHKLKIAAKEAAETEYWLLLCNKSEVYPACEELIAVCVVLLKILSKIIGTSKRNQQTK